MDAVINKSYVWVMNDSAEELAEIASEAEIRMIIGPCEEGDDPIVDSPVCGMYVHKGDLIKLRRFFDSECMDCESMLVDEAVDRTLECGDLWISERERVLSVCVRHDKVVMSVLGMQEGSAEAISWDVSVNHHEMLGTTSVTVNCNITSLAVPLSTFCLSGMPNCNAFAISSHAHVNELYRGRGVGKALQAIKGEVAKELGFGAMVSTCFKDNASQIAVFVKSGWVLVGETQDSMLWKKLLE